MSDFRTEYEKQMATGLAGMGRATEANIFYGPQPTELAEFPGGECPGCHGYGGSNGPEHGFPNGWTCRTCGGSGKLGLVWLKRYLPYPDSHPNKGTKFEHEGWAT